MPDITETAGIILVTVPAVEIGGVALLRYTQARAPGYVDNDLRRRFFRAGHAHAGVFLIFALVALLYLERAGLPNGVDRLVRIGLVVPPIAMPLGFFLSVASPEARAPNRLIWLVFVGAAALAAATVTLGVGLLTA